MFSLLDMFSLHLINKMVGLRNLFDGTMTIQGSRGLIEDGLIKESNSRSSDIPNV
jgi:hypothetical protein